MIHIVGLGAGDLDQLPLGVYRLLTNAEHIFVRTKEHPVLAQLPTLTYTSFDAVYETYDNFEAVYEAIVATLIKEAENKDIIYAVPGHPIVAEKTVQLLLESDVEVSIKGGQSFLDDMFASLQIDPIEGFQLIDATSFQLEQIQLRNHVIFCQVYDEYVASDVKLELMEKLPYDYEVVVVTAAGSSTEEVKPVALYELDRETTLNNLTSVYVPPVPAVLLHSEFASLKETIATLRGPNGCPWDKLQTHQSLKRFLIEEAYELLDAIDEEDDEHIVEELGDVLLQVMLHAQIGEDDGWFNIEDVIVSINEKMIRRHPHVFGGEEKDWETVKQEEKQEKSLLASVPKSLPGLLYAYKLQKKAATVGFDWENPEQIQEKIAEEIAEWKEVLADGTDREAMEAEFGDILFAVVNLGRHYDLDPELAIYTTNRKFQTRFRYIEEQAQAQGKSLMDMTLDEMDHLWNEAKTTRKERGE